MADPTPTTPQDTGILFFSGWRPLIGWITIIALSLNYAITPILRIFLAIHNPSHPVEVPSIDANSLNTLCLTAFGVGTLRTAEKFSGVHNSH